MRKKGVRMDEKSKVEMKLKSGVEGIKDIS